MSQFDVIVSLDTGVSLSKAFWMRWPSGRVELMLMDPELLEIRSADLLDFGLAGGTPQANAIVTLKQGGCLAFGEKARSMRGKPPADLSKYEPAAYKALAVIGSIAQLLSLPESFNLALSAVLPYTEYQDRERFEELLKEHLTDFTFQQHHYCVSLKMLDVKPEGAGVGLMRREDDKFAFGSSNITIVMVGQRDASLLSFKQGAPQLGIGTRLGFQQFLQEVKIRAALNLEPANEALLPELVFRSQAEPRSVERIARMVVSSREVPSKATQINEAIAASQAKYWSDLSDWLQRSLGQSLYELDEVIISGGAAVYFRSELEAFFAQEQVSVSWSGGLDNQINNLLHHQVDSALSFRLADAFGLFKLLGGKVQRLESQTAVAT